METCQVEILGQCDPDTLTQKKGVRVSGNIAVHSYAACGNPVYNSPLTLSLSKTMMGDSGPISVSLPGVTPLSSDYSPSRFYVDSTDKRGHSKQIRVDVPPQSHGLMAVFIASPSLPYATFNEFVRDSIVHNLHRIETLDPDNAELKTITSRIVATANIALIESRLTDEKSLLERYTNALNNPDTNHFVTVEDAQLAYDSILTPSVKRSFRQLLQNNDYFVRD